ncbi:MAG: phosphate ABC transporter, permease protein PstA, partial [Rhodospirillales bacterium]|nr:phosphate ABC transporter, permease protein PstA [Rhodospirillales bacterium]
MDAMDDVIEEKAPSLRRARGYSSSLSAYGEPFLWLHGGALMLGILLISGFLILVVWNGLATFWPRPLVVVELVDGGKVAGEPTRPETFKPGPDRLAALSEAARGMVEAGGGYTGRTLYRIGNFDLYNEDFRWVPDYAVKGTSSPADMVLIERREWGPFVGRVKALDLDGRTLEGAALDRAALASAIDEARLRWKAVRRIERGVIGDINHEMEQARLAARKIALSKGAKSPEAVAAHAEAERRIAELEKGYGALAAQAQVIKEKDSRFRITVEEIGGQSKTMPLSQVVRLYAANALSPVEKIQVYLSRWWEFLSEEPREANTEGGVLPAIFGTFAMTLLMVVLVAPFGIITALYLREYAKQGRLVSIVRISVNNLAGVPSIVYGVFGLGFFAYILGGSIDRLFYPERLPNPT